MSKRSKAPSSAPSEESAREARVAEQIAAAMRAPDADRPPAVKMPAMEGRSLKLDEVQLARILLTLETRVQDFALRALKRIADLTSFGGDLDSEAINAAFALIRAVEPKNELEATIAIQMAEVDALAAQCMVRASKGGQTLELRESYIRQATKLQRTFALQLEQLGRLRSGGKQTHEVRYVYVNGPAVFAGDNASFGGGGQSGNRPQSDTPVTSLALEGGLPMWSADPFGGAMPRPGGQRKEAMQDARRDQPRRAARSQKRRMAPRAEVG